MGYVADFITGRSIAEGDKAYGLVIVPNTRGWPDPVKAAATDPTHPHERFTPISLPLEGIVNDRGYFEPNKKQLGLDLLLQTVGFESWDKFFDEGFNFKDDDGGFMLAGQRVIAGISAMHAGTYRSLLELGTYEGNRQARGTDAARIFMDAKKRFEVGKDDRYFLMSLFQSAPQDDNYTTLEGDVIRVPECAQALLDGHTWQVNRIVRSEIAKRHAKAHLGDGRELGRTFDLLADFQKLCLGMNYIGKYFAPGGFMRHDNLYLVARTQIATLKSTFENCGTRRRTGYDWADESFIDDMEAVAEQLRQLHGVVEDEISKARKFFADESLDEDEDDDLATNPSP